ncbi:alpha-galactose transferase [Priestia megaterium]|uniref:glycosyltransferase family 4 protein n=1 Tax=Priestia megaterium TaxID=1404 RepID=UPI00094DCE3C|nr:glycosyltransferase family 4 protein [Priestia megaterium]OLO27351.1 alpha-galactose transferase [Priestia megaterium]
MKYRILYIQPYASHVGGVDTVLLQLIEGLDKEIFEPIVVLPSYSPYVEKYNELGAKVIYEKIAVFGKPTNWTYYFKNIYKLCVSLKSLRKVVKSYKIDLIHSHKMENIGGNIVGKILRIPTVQTVHELPRKPLIAYKAVGYINHLFNDYVIVLCDRSKAVLEWGKHKSHKVRKIYNGIKVNEQVTTDKDLRKELNLHPQDKIAVTVARLSPMKGIEYLIEAAHEVKKYDSSIKFVIVGDVAFDHEKEYKESLIRKSEELNLGKNILFLGLRRDVPNLLKQSDVFILPSVYDIFPTVILEAMSCSLPVIGTDVGGVPEMIKDNTGILVPPTDSKALAKAIIRLFNEEDYKEIGREGRKLLEEKFTQEKYVSQTVNLYTQLLSSRG